MGTDGNTAATLVGLVTTPTTVTAGPFYNGGMFSVALPGNWTAPQTADSAAAGYTAIDAANSSSTFDTPYTRGREFRVPIRSMTSAGKTLTITYTGIAPLVAEDSQFEFKSRGAEAGTLTSITDTGRS